MTMIYSNPARENENDGALPDVEVWQHHHTQLGGCQPSVAPSWPCAGAGWYWQAGTSGRTPAFDYSTWTPDPDDGPHGPFDTEAEAIADAQSGAVDDDTPACHPDCGPIVQREGKYHVHEDEDGRCTHTDDGSEFEHDDTPELPESVLSALERAIRDVCDEDTQNAISDRYRELMGETDDDEQDEGQS